MHCINRTGRISIFIPVFFAVSACAAQIEQGGTQPTPVDTSVPLRSGEMLLTSDTTEQALEDLRSADADGIHVVIKTNGNLTVEQRSDLENRGVAIIDPLGHSAYIARLSKSFAPDDDYHRDVIVNMAQFQSEDKVVPAIWSEDQTESAYIIRQSDEDSHNYVLNADGTLNLTVQFYRGGHAGDLQLRPDQNDA